MRKISLTAALIATTLSTAAVAADWFYVTSGPGFDDYIDRESIRTMPNGNKRAWVMRVYDSPDKLGNTSVWVLSEFDCREGRSRALQSSSFRDEKVTSTDDIPSGWIYAPPESVAEAQLNYACFGKLPE